MSFNFLNNGQSGDATKFTPIDTFIDPVSKIRVSNPSNLIDTDFEYGLQPTKWETVEIINNTPAFFSKGGDTSIPDIISITTNAGTKEITVNTAFPHGLAVGIPIRVSGTKSVSADGSYIINATPSITSFTYLSRLDEPETISIYDLYTSVITGEFFQGSQISIDEAEGITTDGSGPTSTLTIKTANNHGFGQNTPFYFLNLNSTITQEFESQNTTSVSFDPTNSGEAQTFDGSNTLLQTPIDLSNSATTSIYQNNISATDPLSSSLTLSLNASDSANWDNLVTGDPLYYDVSAGSGYFQANPRGIVFIKNVDGINTGSNTATFQVSSLPDAAALPILANTTGFFQIADQAKTFAGNNLSQETQIGLTVEIGQDFVFDGGNQGYDGAPESPPNNTSTVIGYTGTSMTVFTPEGSLDYYVGAMLRYSSTGTVATGLANNATYFVTAFATGAGSGQFTMSVAELPGGTPIDVSGGSGTQTFSKIGVSIDKDILHIRNSNFAETDMIEYTAPTTGAEGFGADFEQKFYFVAEAYDSHNYLINATAELFTPMVATGGTILPDYEYRGRTWRVHQFTTVGNSTFTVQTVGSDPTVEYLVVGGGGGGGVGGGGGGGYRSSVAGENSGGGVSAETVLTLDAGVYKVTVGAGGAGKQAGTSSTNTRPGNSSVFSSVTSAGGGLGRFSVTYDFNSGDGGSGGGGGPFATAPGAATSAQGFAGGSGNGSTPLPGGGGGGAAEVGVNYGANGGDGGDGVASSITGSSVTRGGGGGGGHHSNIAGGLGGPGGGGDAGDTSDKNGSNGSDNTGGGGGGAIAPTGASTNLGTGGIGGSGVVIFTLPIQALLATFSGGVTQSSVVVGAYRVYTVTATSTTDETVTIS